MIAHHARKARVVALSTVMLSFALVVAAVPWWASEAGLDVWNLSAVRQQLSDVDQQRIGIDSKFRESQREKEACGHIATQLVNGTITLEQAVAELSPILANREGFYAGWKHLYKVPTFKHGVARYAITRAQSLLEGDAARFAEVTERLERQYAAIG